MHSRNSFRLDPTRDGVHQLINFGQGKAIFRTSSIEACEVNAYSPLTRLILYHHYVGQPDGGKELL